MKHRILYFMPEGQKNSPVRYYRGEGALEKQPWNKEPSTAYGSSVQDILLHLYNKVEVIYPTPGAPIWRDLTRATVAFFLRCWEPHHVQLAQECKDRGLPVWYDLDDALLNIPRSHPAYWTYQDQGARANIETMLDLADVVTVSTEHLKKQIETGYWDLETEKELANSKVRLVPNALDLDLFPMGHEYPPHRYMTWRGGATHRGDLEHPQVQKAFQDFFTYTRWQVRFLGFDPYFIQASMANPSAYFFRPYQFDYFHFMRSLKEEHRPMAHVVPLVDNTFNRCKSNIAALEALWAGAVPVVPAWPEWEIPGAIQYKNLYGLEDAMLRATQMTDAEYRDRVKQGQDWIMANRSLVGANALRLEVLRGLTKG